MKISEAIAEIRNIQKFNYTLADDEVFELAIQSLGKQIPKKPLFSTVNRDTVYHCSSCNKFVGFYDTRRYDYCHNCGQKIDWKG